MLKKWSKFNENNNEFDLSSFIDDIRDNFIDLEDKELLTSYEFKINEFDRYPLQFHLESKEDRYIHWKTYVVDLYNKSFIKNDAFLSINFKLNGVRGNVGGTSVLDEKGILQLNDIISNYVLRISKEYDIKIDLNSSHMYYKPMSIYIKVK